MLTTVYQPKRSLLKKTGDAANASPNNRRTNQSTVNSSNMSSKIRKFRVALMLTQQEFANLHGVSQELVAAVENDTRSNNLDVDYNELTPQNSIQLLRQVQFIRLFRESGLTQVEFAAKVGIIQADISKYLAQNKYITTKRWLRIVERLGVDVTVTVEDWKAVRGLFGRRIK